MSWLSIQIMTSCVMADGDAGREETVQNSKAMLQIPLAW